MHEAARQCNICDTYNFRSPSRPSCMLLSSNTALKLNSGRWWWWARLAGVSVNRQHNRNQWQTNWSRFLRTCSFLATNWHISYPHQNLFKYKFGWSVSCEFNASSYWLISMALTTVEDSNRLVQLGWWIEKTILVQFRLFCIESLNIC